MQTNPAVEQNKMLNGPLVRGTSPVGKEKVYGGNDLVKSQVLSSEWKTERVREDASGDCEDGKEDDDDMPCVIGESEGDCEAPVARGNPFTLRYHNSPPYSKVTKLLLTENCVILLQLFCHNTRVLKTTCYVSNSSSCTQRSAKSSWTMWVIN